jgi:hypothetical protein
MVRLLVATVLLFAQVVQARDVRLVLVEQRTSEETGYVLNLDNLKAHRVQPPQGASLPQSSKYTSQNRKLVNSAGIVADADDVLFQCEIEGLDLVIVRDEYNSFASPLDWFAAFIGHPVQVSRIVAITIKDNQVISEREITRKASSYHWAARVLREAA